ncbi:MAG: RrF2 family transcriptional regulator [bacterium]
MSIIFSRGCEYALQAMIYLAVQPSDTPVFQREISEALNIPPHYLGKVLQSLSRSRLVISQKGKAGGFMLGKPPKSITPLDIIQAVDGPVFFDDCILGFADCSDEEPCPVHSQWKKVKQQFILMLQNKNIHQLSQELDSKLISIKKLLSNR